jgi:hypothetical protein
MCTSITLIAATDDMDRMNAILASLDRRGHARRAGRVDIRGLRPLLTATERAYHLAQGMCDCGTFLGHARTDDAGPDGARAAVIARYRRKGWSEARIARAMADRDRAAARPPRRQPNEDAAYWIELTTLLGAGLGLGRLGLMHHFCRGSPGDGPETATRRDAGLVTGAALARMADGVIHDFGIGARRG